MTNWNDPTTLQNQYLSLVKLQHVLGGIYIWEVVSNVHRDWKQISHPSTGSAWVKWTYLACRYLMLGATFAILISFDATSGVDCKVLVKSVYAFPYFSHLLASVLIAIRVIAIWNYNRFCIVAVALLLCSQTAVYIFDLVEEDNSSCQLLQTQNNRPYVTVSLIADFVLLVIMLVGLLRLRQASRFALWKYLWTQGLIWLALATIAEVPAMVFIWLNLNQIMNLMFLIPEVVIVTIGATRMYRTLSDYTKSYRPNSSNNSPNWFRSVKATPPTSGTMPNAIPMQPVRVPNGTFSSTSTTPVQIKVHRTFE